MKTKNLSKLLSLLLAISLILSLGAGLSVSAEDTVTPPTTITFDDGVNPFVAKVASTLAPPTSVVSALANGNKAWNITSIGTLNYQMGSGITYGRGVHNSGVGISVDSWGENVRPTKVSFKYKNQETSSFSFFPVWTLSDPDTITNRANNPVNYYYLDFTSQTIGGTITNANQGNIHVTTHGLALQSVADDAYPVMNTTTESAQMTLPGTVSGTTAETYSFTNTDTEDKYSSLRANLFPTGADGFDDSAADDVWQTVTCEYDWSKFTSENSYTLGLKFTIVTEKKTMVIEDFVCKDSLDTTITSDTQGFTFGFSSSQCNTWCVDDITVESYDCVTGATYAPATDEEPEDPAEPAPNVKGATIKKSGTQDIQFTYSTGDANESNPIVEYGMLLTMKNKGIAADDFDLDNTEAIAANDIKTAKVDNVSITEKSSFVASIGAVPENLYTYRYQTRVYVKYQDGSIVYSDIEEKSVAGVAKSIAKWVLDNKDSITGLEGDITTLVNADGTLTDLGKADNGAATLAYLETNNEVIATAMTAAGL